MFNFKASAALSIHKAALSLCLALGFSSQVFAVSLTDVAFNPLANGKTQIHMRFDGPAPSLSAYALEDPNRLVLDLKKTKSALNRKSYAVRQGDVSSALAIAAGDRVRFVVDMKRLAPYVSSVQGDNLYVTIGGGNSAGLASNSSKRDSVKLANNTANSGPDRLQVQSSSAASSVRNGVRDVSFERTSQGAGEIRIKMSNPDFSASSRKSGNAVYVDIPRAYLTKSAPRTNNLSQFGSVVKSVSSKNVGSKVQVKINTGGNFAYEAYQIDDSYIVSFSPKGSSKSTVVQNRASSTSDSRAYSGDKLSLNFQDIEVRSVLQLIADFTDLNLVASDTVQGNITLRLKNVPWDQALDIVLKAKGLDKRREGNILMVAPADEIATRERKELEASKQLEQFEPLVTEHIKVKYADASEIFNVFLSNNSGNRNDYNNNNNSSNDKGTRGDSSQANSVGEGILSSRGSVIVDERTNSLFVTETADRLAKLKTLLNKIDIPIRQVMVEARIVLANKSAVDRIGVSWGGSYDSGQTTVSGLGTGGMIADFDVVSTTGIQIGRAISGGLLDLQLMALEESGNGEVISRPKVITGDKKQASIKSGTEVPYTTISDGTVTTEFKPVLLKLDVTPYITPDGRVIMDLVINQDSVGENVSTANGDVPRIETTELNTQVLASDGETIVLGGVFSENSTVTDRKTPLLGDLPVIGKLFSSQSREVSKSETLIFITPKIIDEKLIR